MTPWVTALSLDAVEKVSQWQTSAFSRGDFFNTIGKFQNRSAMLVSVRRSSALCSRETQDEKTHNGGEHRSAENTELHMAL
jgi:hypothetical protein